MIDQHHRASVIDVITDLMSCAVIGQLNYCAGDKRLNEEQWFCRTYRGLEGLLGEEGQVWSPGVCCTSSCSSMTGWLV